MKKNSWTKFREEILALIVGAPIVCVMLALAHGGRALAVRFGYPGQSGFNAVVVLLLVLAMALLLRLESPQQRRTHLYRMLSGAVTILGLLGIVKSATQVPFDQWTILFVSFYILMAIGLVLQFGWVLRRYPYPGFRVDKKALDGLSD